MPRQLHDEVNDSQLAGSGYTLHPEASGRSDGFTAFTDLWGSAPIAIGAIPHANDVLVLSNKNPETTLKLAYFH